MKKYNRFRRNNYYFQTRIVSFDPKETPYCSEWMDAKLVVEISNQFKDYIQSQHAYPFEVDADTKPHTTVVQSTRPERAARDLAKMFMSGCEELSFTPVDVTIRKVYENGKYADIVIHTRSDKILQIHFETSKIVSFERAQQNEYTRSAMNFILQKRMDSFDRISKSDDFVGSSQQYFFSQAASLDFDEIHESQILRNCLVDLTKPNVIVQFFKLQPVFQIYEYMVTKHYYKTSHEFVDKSQVLSSFGKKKKGDDLRTVMRYFTKSLFRPFILNQSLKPIYAYSAVEAFARYQKQKPNMKANHMCTIRESVPGSKSTNCLKNYQLFTFPISVSVDSLKDNELVLLRNQEFGRVFQKKFLKMNAGSVKEIESSTVKVVLSYVHLSSMSHSDHQKLMIRNSIKALKTFFGSKLMKPVAHRDFKKSTISVWTRNPWFLMGCVYLLKSESDILRPAFLELFQKRNVISTSSLFEQILHSKKKISYKHFANFMKRHLTRGDIEDPSGYCKTRTKQQMDMRNSYMSFNEAAGISFVQKAKVRDFKRIIPKQLRFDFMNSQIKQIRQLIRKKTFEKTKYSDSVFDLKMEVGMELLS